MRTTITAIIYSLFISFLCNAQDVYLYTPNGSQVYAFQRTEMSPYEIAYYTERYAITYPYAEILANASTTYNCHSYAWNMIEGGSIFWLNQSPDLHKYWDDGSYEETTEGNAKKIFYYNGDHSAVKSTTHPGKYESKWGSMPLMRHDPEYGPTSYSMEYRRYYKCSTRNFTNQTVTTNTTVTSCGNINVQNVTVQSNAKLTINAPGAVSIEGPFSIDSGSQFEVNK
jgi:hypothetical protein